MSKIPPQAKKVFDGIIFDVYHWQQKMFDGSPATFEMLKRPDTVVILALTPDNQLIIIEEEQPHKPKAWQLPAGQVDGSETPLKAAQRELAEETGYSGGQWELWQQIEPLHKIEWTAHYFIARGVEKTQPQKLDAGERITVKLEAIDEFLESIVDGRIRGYELESVVLRAKIDPKTWKALRQRLTG